MKKTKIGPVEKGKQPKEKKKPESMFDNMSEGDSLFYSGNRNDVIIKFGYYCARGMYKTEKEGDGWRFYLLKKPNKK